MTQCDPNRETSRNFHYLITNSSLNAADMSTIVQQWANEKEHYNITTGNCAANWHCDYYKQLVWASTYKVGCGIKLCHTTMYMKESPDIEQKYAFVCYYIRAGNFGDRSPYRQGPPCSKCGKQIPWTWCCENNLCVPK